MAGDASWFDITAQLHELEPEWRRLAARSDNVFATWEWQSCWWRHFGRSRPLRLVTVRTSKGEALAILPLYRAARIPVRVVRFLGHGVSDQLGPIGAPADRKIVADMLGELFADEALGADLLIADELPGDTAWGDVAGASVLGRSTSPVPMLDPDVALPRNPRLRAEVRRKEQRLRAKGRVTLRTTTDPARLSADFTTFLALHAARWKSHGGSRSFANREFFHRDFAARALEQGWLRLRFLELDGVAIAALYNLAFGDRESNYQAGRDPAFADYSVGLLLHAHAMHDAARAGCTEYRFLRGGEPYKARFADTDSGLESIVFARGAAARAMARAIAPVPRLPRPARRAVPAPYAWGTGGSPRWSRP
jgi:CelD/BcsL family acetyltransferase involved in cellulose biosynthesis